MIIQDKLCIGRFHQDQYSPVPETAFHNPLGYFPELVKDAR